MYGFHCYHSGFALRTLTLLSLCTKCSNPHLIQLPIISQNVRTITTLAIPILAHAPLQTSYESSVAHDLICGATATHTQGAPILLFSYTQCFSTKVYVLCTAVRTGFESLNTGFWSRLCFTH